MTHPYFDDLRDEGVTFPNGNLLPDIFNFTEFELMKATIDLKEILLPHWYMVKNMPSLVEDKTPKNKKKRSAH